MVLAASAVVGFVVILIATQRYGIGITFDSLVYFSGAENLAQGHGFLRFDGSFEVLRGPLYPLLLAVPAWIGDIAPAVAARYLQATLFALIVYTTGAFGVRLLKNAVHLVGVLLLYVLLSYPVLEVSTQALSEPLFILLVLLFLGHAMGFQEGGGYRPFVAMVLLTVLATLTRYVGIVLVPVGLISILLARKCARRTRMQFGLLFLVLAPLPVVLWGTRNLALSGAFFGPRTAAAPDFLGNFSLAISQFLGWFVPPPLPRYALLLAGIALLVAGLELHRLHRTRVSARILMRHTAPLVLFGAGYTLLLLLITSSIELNAIDARYMSPVYIPAVLVGLSYTQRLFAPPLSRLGRGLLTSIVALIVMLGLVYPLWLTSFVIQLKMREGAGGYHTREWMDSSLLHYLNGEFASELDEDDQALYSNSAGVLWFFTGLDSIRTPARTQRGTPQPLRKIAKPWPSRPGYLVWFDDVHRDYLYTPDELRAVARLRRTVTFEEGTIYYIAPLP